MRIDILTLFPGMFRGPFDESIVKRARERGLVEIFLHDIRGYATDRHRVVDDYPYGGGPGMVMKPEPIFLAVESVAQPTSSVILLSPTGRVFHQSIAADEISIGDYVLTGGELAALVVIDAVARLLPGVLGHAESAGDESHSHGL